MKMFVLYYLRFFAKLALFFNKPKIIGITGSVGKSSTRNAIFSMMKDYFKVKIIKEGNSETGIPLGILGINPGHYRLFDWIRVIIMAPFKINNIKGVDYLIVEMGIDSPYPPKNMDYLLTIVKPDISVVLNAYPVHTMQFDKLYKDEDEKKRLELIMKRITEEKLKIITKAKPKIGIFNELASFHPTGAVGMKLIKFGKSKQVEIKYLDYQVNLDKTVFKYFLKEDNQIIEIVVRGFCLPKAYEEVFAATVAVGKSLGLTNKQIIKGISNNFNLPPGRASIFNGINSSIIIDSSYNASRASVLTFLDLAKNLSKKENQPLILLLGDMRELGKEEKIEHQTVAKKIVDIKPQQILLVGPNTKKYIIPKLIRLVDGIRHFKNSIEAGEFLCKQLPYRSIILVKGSQNEIFLEEAIKKILKNKNDIQKLCRQNDFWLRKKSQYFQSV